MLIGSLGVDDARKIVDLKVFAVTAVFSVLAYLWLVVILVFISPDIVDIWEGAPRPRRSRQLMRLVQLL